jgi:hypothetical protein
MRLVLAAVLCLAACHDHDHEGFATFQACYDDHHVDEMLGVQESLVVCCLDHPIDGHSEVCGSTATECVTYLTANVQGPTQAEVMASCTEYVTQKGM